MRFALYELRLIGEANGTVENTLYQLKTPEQCTLYIYCKQNVLVVFIMVVLLATAAAVEFDDEVLERRPSWGVVGLLKLTEIRKRKN